MNLYRRELKANLKSLVLWTVSVIAIIAMGVAKTYQAARSGQSLTELVASMPKSIQTIFGLGKLDLTTAIGVYGIIFLYIVLLGGLYAANLGSRIAAKEETDKTFEFLYSKGISRNTILFAKMLAVGTYLLIFWGLTYLASVIILKQATGEEITNQIFECMIGLLLILFFFAMLGLFLSVLLSVAKRAASVNAFILLVAFLASILTGYSDALAWLGYFTPFHYFDAKVVITEGLNPVSIIGMITLIVLCIAGSFYYHSKRDLH